MPVHTPPHKAGEPDPGPEHRLAMCRLAVAGEDGLGACSLEVDRGGPSYTVDTLRAVHASDPRAELTFIVGADTASTLPSWREPRAVLAMADVAVVARSGTDEDDVRARLAGLLAGGAGARTAVRFVQMPPVEVSSSLARERAAAGEPLQELVGPAVARYIAEHGLYRAAGEAA
jgi:nicotinate-nucleotide adenylyltransferase